MGGVSVGFFTPLAVVRDVPAFCGRIRRLLPVASRGFPLAAEQIKGQDGKAAIALAVVSGSVPVHINQPNANEESSSIFQFVFQAENRPCLLSAPADERTTKAVLMPDQRSKFAMGALELVPGRAIHFDITAHFHAIVGMPTGDPVAAEPEAVIVQVPWPRAEAIGHAIGIMQRTLRADERFADLVR